ncbi:MAG: helix-turn-helix transcriptional regulator, partial [Acetobacteraceae bacterium]|nr:helix-turn-helix transcriptional regulator [Acetobacteraceae bacterium]
MLNEISPTVLRVGGEMASLSQTFADPEQLSAAIYPSNVEIMPLERGRFTAEFTAVDLPRVWLRRFRASLPRIAHVQHAPKRVFLALQAGQTHKPIFVDGSELGVGELIQFAHGSSSDQRSLTGLAWANISVDRADFHPIMSGLAGEDPMKDSRLNESRSRIFAPEVQALNELRNLHATIMDLAKNSPEVLARPETARDLDQAMLQAILDCLTHPDERQETAARVRHKVVLERFRALLDANLDEVLYLPEVCSALAVSHRTLSYCCQESLGVSPKKYFLLRRMYMVRRALRESDPKATTVSEIATRYGFWELGRF